MSRLAFVASAGERLPMLELVETLRYELDRQDMPSTLSVDGFTPPAPDLVHVLVSPREFVEAHGEESLPDDEILRRTIFLSAGDPETFELRRDGRESRVRVQEEYLALLRRAGAVFDTSAPCVAALRRLGVPARHLRPGYSTLRDNYDPAATRTIDVIFLGERTRRRTWQLNRCAAGLAGFNTLLRLPERGAEEESGLLSSADKAELLSRSRIVLGIHPHDRGRGLPQFDWLTALDAAHAGAVLVAERGSGVAPLVAGEHVLLADPTSFPYVLEAALRDLRRLERIAAAAHERVRTWQPFALPVSVFRAAAVELVGRPLPEKPRLPARRGSVAPAVTWTPPGLAQDGTVRQLQAQLQGLEMELALLGRRLARGSTEPGEGAAWQIAHVTPAWGAEGESRVAVLLAVRDRERVIASTLSALERSRLRDLELIIVDDASADGTVEAARRWLDARPLVPAVLVRSIASCGIGAARNEALRLARAPLCLILDADTEIFPRCLEVLAGTLDAVADAAIVYPMLQVTGSVDAFVAGGEDFLLNAGEWSASALRRWVRVDSLAMMRTRQLREIGGFATDPALRGWEDYDLWCRVADASLRGQLVPQILARYRARADLVGEIRYRGPAEALAALSERAPRLLAGVVPAAQETPSGARA